MSKISPIPLMQGSQKVSHLVERLETLATQEDRGSQPVFVEARRLRADLVLACGRDPGLRHLRRQGVDAYNKVRDVRFAAVETEKAEQSENARTKRRIITAIDAAASSDDPARFRKAIQDICHLYRDTKSAGPENAALAEAFRAALGAFRAAVDANKPARHEPTSP